MDSSPFCHRVTRTLGRLLSRCGVDAEQYHWLLQTSLRMDFRVKNPRTATKESLATKSRLAFTIFMNLAISAVLAFGFWKLGARTVAFTTATMAFGMLVIASTTVVEFARTVIAPDDFLILAHRPISARTFYAVKISNLIFYLFISGVSLFIVPAFYGICCSDSRWFYPLLYLPIAGAGSVFVVGFIVAIYNIAFRFGGFRKSLNMILILQATLTFFVFSIYHLFPWFVSAGASAVRDANILNLWNSWARLFPSFWFSGVMELALGHTGRLATILAMIAAIGLVLVCPVLLRSISLDYSSHLQQTVIPDRVHAKTSLAKLAKKLTGLSRLLLKDSEEEAFFRFTLSMLRHNLLLKMQFYPTVGIIAAIFVPPLITKSHLIDPFVQADFGRAAMLSITSFMFGIGGLAVLLPYSNEYEAGWLFQIAPVSRLGTVLSALKKAVAAVLLLPIFLLNLLFFSLFWPFIDALKISVFGLLLGFVLLQIVLLTFRGFPFSRKIERVVVSRFLLIFFTMMTLPFVLIYLPSPFAGNPARFLSILLGLLVFGVLLGGVNSYFYVRSGRRSPGGAPSDVRFAQQPSQLM